jgi:coenzyme F420-reducing hydrogenase delta subunit
MEVLGSVGVHGASGAPVRAPLTVFVCAHCARPGQAPTSAGRPRPAVPDFDWSVPVQQVLVPCSGRLQPEHILKAFESGASVVGVVACAEGNCHNIEGSRRCALRTDFVGSILSEIGLGKDRLMLFHLPGSAEEDMEAGEGRPARLHASEILTAQIEKIRERVMIALATLPPSPLQEAPPPARAPLESLQEMDTSDDDSDE